MTEQKQVRCAKSADLKPGDRLSYKQYFVVDSLTRTDILATDDFGANIRISRNIADEAMFSADQYDEEERVSRTELVEKLEAAGDTIFTVCFRKQVKPKEAAQGVAEAVEGASIKDVQKAIEKAMKSALSGEERVLVGHLVSTEPKMGRSTVVDLEIPQGKHRLRLVDHRTVEWLILRGVKYVVKK